MTALLLASILLAALPALPGSSPAEPEVIDLTGHYAAEVRVTSRSGFPLLPSVRSTTVSLLLVEVDGAPGRWRQRHRVCEARIEGGSLVRMTIPDAFVRAMPTRGYPVQLESGDGAPRYRADMGLEAIGFDPAVTGGRLPADAGAAGVIDADGDGAPGATVLMDVPGISDIRLHIAQRSRLVLSGESDGAGGWRGGIDIPLLEQRTLGADPEMFARTPRLQAEPRRSGFRMVPLHGQGGCDAVARALRSAGP